MKTLFSLKSSARMEDIMDKHITTPITEEVTKDLKSGDYVYITGTIYVARDAAHKRMIEALQRGEELPIDIKDSTIIIWVHLRRARADRSVLQDRPQPPAWTDMHRHCLIWEKRQ